MLKIILTGSTGMVGEGVLLECLKNPKVESILVVNRKSCGYMHPKLKELLLPDFFRIQDISDQLRGYNTCLFCLGVSSVGMKEDAYTKITYDLTMLFAKTLLSVNPDMSFSYISGAGTDSSENGKMMWARVKGKTENDLRKLAFRKVYAFRPGVLKASKGQKFVLKYYPYFSWLYPVIKTLFPSKACSIAELGAAMLHVSETNFEIQILEVKDILEASKRL